MKVTNRFLHTAKKLLGMWGKGASLGLAAACLSMGCEALEKHSAKEGFNMGFLKKKEPPVQIVSTWKPEVVFVADPANQGRPNPGLAGRVYLFQQDLGTSATWDGKLEIDLFDLGVAQGTVPVHMERWEYDAASLSKLIRKDPIGDGYTLFLPWGTYREDIQKIQLKLKFDHGGTFPLYGDTGTITLNGPLKMTSHSTTMMPDQFANQPPRAPGNPAGSRTMDPRLAKPETPLRQVIPRPEHPLMPKEENLQQLPPPRQLPGQNQPMGNPIPGRMELPAPRMDVPSPLKLPTPGAAPAPVDPPMGINPAVPPADPSQSRAKPAGNPPTAPRLELVEPGDPSLARKTGSAQSEGQQKVWTLR